MGRKTALVLDLRHVTKAIQPDRYRAFYETRAVPDNVTVWTAASVGQDLNLFSAMQSVTIGETASFNEHGILVAKPATVGDGALVTLRVYRLVLQVLFHYSSMPEGESFDAQFLQQIWPRIDRPVDGLHRKLRSTILASPTY